MDTVKIIVGSLLIIVSLIYLFKSPDSKILGGLLKKKKSSRREIEVVDSNVETEEDTPCEE